MPHSRRKNKNAGKVTHPANEVVADDAEDVLKSNLAAWARDELDERNVYPMQSKERTSMKKEIGKDEDEITRLNRDMARIAKRILDIRFSIIKKHVTLAPIRRIPPEVLSQVFQQEMPIEFPSDALYLYRIMAVCRLWRNVACNTPELWSTVNVGWQNLYWERIGAADLKLWLSRSGQVPLSILISRLSSTEITAIIKDHIQHTKSLNLSPDFRLPPTNVEDIFYAVDSPSVNLQSLYLAEWSLPSHDHGMVINLPSLKVMRLGICEPFAFPFICPSLEKLEIEFVRLRNPILRLIASNCPRLEDLSFQDCIGDPHPNDRGPERILFGSVVHLAVDNSDLILERLACPHLLQLTHDVIDFPTPLPSLPQLRTLELKCHMPFRMFASDVTVTQMWNWFAATPSLQNLRVRNGDRTAGTVRRYLDASKILEMLVAMPDLLSDLKEVSFTGAKLDKHILLRFGESRASHLNKRSSNLTCKLSVDDCKDLPDVKGEVYEEFLARFQAYWKTRPRPKGT